MPLGNWLPEIPRPHLPRGPPQLPGPPAHVLAAPAPGAAGANPDVSAAGVVAAVGSTGSVAMTVILPNYFLAYPPPPELVLWVTPGFCGFTGVNLCILP